MPLDEELIKILVCPVSKAPLRLSADGQWLICDESKLRYPIVDDIPQLLASCAQPWEEEK